jgi:hypothetical protein
LAHRIPTSRQPWTESLIKKTTDKQSGRKRNWYQPDISINHHGCILEAIWFKISLNGKNQVVLMDSFVQLSKVLEIVGKIFKLGSLPMMGRFGYYAFKDKGFTRNKTNATEHG